MSDANQSFNPGTSHETCALESSFDVSFDQLNTSMEQGMKREENISPLKNSTNESLFQEHPSLADNSIDTETNEGPNNLPHIVMQNETVPARPRQSQNTNKDTTMNK